MLLLCSFARSLECRVYLETISLTIFHSQLKFKGNCISLFIFIRKQQNFAFMLQQHCCLDLDKDKINFSSNLSVMEKLLMKPTPGVWREFLQKGSFSNVGLVSLKWQTVNKNLILKLLLERIISIWFLVKWTKTSAKLFNQSAGYLMMFE